MTNAACRKLYRACNPSHGWISATTQTTSASRLSFYAFAKLFMQGYPCFQQPQHQSQPKKWPILPARLARPATARSPSRRIFLRRYSSRILRHTRRLKPTLSQPVIRSLSTNDGPEEARSIRALLSVVAKDGNRSSTLPTKLSDERPL